MVTSFAQLEKVVPQQLALWSGQLGTQHPDLNAIFAEVMHLKAQLQACEHPSEPPVFCWLQKLKEIDGTIKSIAEGWLTTNLANLEETGLTRLLENLNRATEIGDASVRAKVQEVENKLSELEFEIVGVKSRQEEISLAIRQGKHDVLKTMRLSPDEALHATEEYIKQKAWEKAEDWLRKAMVNPDDECAQAQALMLCIRDGLYGLSHAFLCRFAESIQDIPALVLGLRRLLVLNQGLLVDRLLACSPLDTHHDADLLILRGERLLFPRRYEEALEIFDLALTINEGHKEALNGRAVALSQLGREREAQDTLGRLQMACAHERTAAAARGPLEEELKRLQRMHVEWLHAPEDCSFEGVQRFEHNPVLGPFFRTLASNLNTKFDGIYGAASGVVQRAPTSSADTVAKVLSFIPIVGAAFGWGVSERFNEIFKERCLKITELFEERAALRPHVIQAARLLTERYREQIACLQEEDRKKLARCAAERIYNYLVYNPKAKFTVDNFGTEIALGVQVMRLSHGKLSICEVPVEAVPKDVIVRTIDGVEWTIAGIFDCTEIEHEERAYFIPTVTDPKYGRRGCDPLELKEPLWKLAPS